MAHPQKLPSKTHSCSELASASKKVMAVKKEREEEAALQRKIQEHIIVGYLFESAELFQTFMIFYVKFPPNKAFSWDAIGGCRKTLSPHAFLSSNRQGV